MVFQDFSRSHSLRGNEAKRWTTNDHIHSINANQTRKFIRSELSDIPLQNVFYMRKVAPQSVYSWGIKIQRSDTPKSRPLHPKRKTATPAEKIYKLVQYSSPVFLFKHDAKIAISER